MKTAEEVKAWLEKQDWYDRYVNNIKAYNHNKEEERELLNGKKAFKTITYAFAWHITPEGAGFWGEVNDRFQLWYNSEQQNEPTPEQMDKNISELIFDNGQTDHKNDRKDNKLPWELLPIEVIEEAVKVYQFGAEKYGENTWQKLENGKERYYAALMRHLVAWRKGETKDEESQLHPLSHVIWNAIALLWLEMNNK